MKTLMNPNLLSLQCVLFFFFGGLGCLLPFLPLHMLDLGLNVDEARIISIVTPCIAILGPLVVGPLADRLAGNTGSGGDQPEKTGKYLRVMIALCMLFAAIFYMLLMAVPPVARFEARRPSVTFTCDMSGGVVLQERCTEERKCYHWDEEKVGSLLLSNCRYACHKPPSSEHLHGDFNATDATKDIYTDDPSYLDYSDEIGKNPSEVEVATEMEPTPDDTENARRRRQAPPQVLDPPPHICYKELDGVDMCQLYTKSSKTLNVHITLMQATNSDADHEEWCRYPVAGAFQCRIYPEVVHALTDPIYNANSNVTCQPVVECDVDDPYDATNSVLAESQCVQMIGDPDVTFWTYLVLRSIADIFPTAALALLDAAVVIATRETSTGRGDVGRQLAFGALGLAIFAPIVGLIREDVHPPPFAAYSTAIIVFAIFMFITAAIMLFARKMPLSPPEWWWHTRSGMLALPMSAVRKYGPEIASLLAVVMLLGMFWSAIDTYLPWHIQELSGRPFLIGLTITFGAVPAIPFLWYAERIVDYCGHTNLLITAFTVYIVRYAGLSYISCPWWSLLFESLEVFTLIVMWVTVILYLRHLVPRRFTVTGQAAAVLAHFCTGRFLGAIIGSVTVGSLLDSHRYIYRVMSICAAVVAILYFCIYHFIFKPRYAAPISGAQRQPPTIMQDVANINNGMNGNGTNGTYTPLRVYHNGRARKGQFRY